MILSRLARDLGTGIVAGLAGTAAITVSSTVEQKLRDRPASDAPARAAEKLLAIEKFASDDAERRFGTLAHWGYGTAWGMVRAPRVRAEPLRWPPARTSPRCGAVILPTLDVAPPATMWARQEVAIDVGHHLVYEAVSTLTYEWLRGQP
jgi:hypothetical protein